MSTQHTDPLSEDKYVAHRAYLILQVIMLLLGGFAIASALSKHYIAKAMATWVLLKVGQKPSRVLLASMFVAMFASMWISNVAAPALCFSLLQPILRTLETGDMTSRSLVMGKTILHKIICSS